MLSKSIYWNEYDEPRKHYFLDKEYLITGEWASDHPLVKSISLHGGGSISDAVMHDFVTITLKDGTEKQFVDCDKEYSEVENWLDSLQSKEA